MFFCSSTGENAEVTVTRARRKTIGITVREKGKIEVKIPKKFADAQVEKILEKHRTWIEKKIADAAVREEESKNIKRLTEEEIREIKKAAAEYFKEKTKENAQKMKLTYGKITVRMQKTRWGSCSANGNLNFNCMLMAAPEKVRESVIVHELCHTVEMNHGERFKKMLYRYMPEYDECRKWLKENGDALMKMGGIK